MKFSIKNFFSKCDQIHSFLTNLVTFTEEILNENLHYWCSVICRLDTTKHGLIKHYFINAILELSNSEIVNTLLMIYFSITELKGR